MLYVALITLTGALASFYVGLQVEDYFVAQQIKKEFEEATEPAHAESKDEMEQVD